MIATEKDKIPYIDILRQKKNYKADIEAGNLVRLPGELIAPYELNARYWICGWDSERCTLTIQDRALMDEAARAALGREDANGKA